MRSSTPYELGITHRRYDEEAKAAWMRSHIKFEVDCTTQLPEMLKAKLNKLKTENNDTAISAPAR